jgi:hypothetical protein
MKNIEDSGFTYTFIKVEDAPEDIKIILKAVNPIEGQCLKNSYEVAKKDNSIKMVEGFLITYFEDVPLDCVAHVWNTHFNSHFDITIGVKKHNRKIMKNEYYIGSIYEFKDAKLTQKTKKGANMYDLWDIENYIEFKTNLKEIENDFQKYVKNLKAK